MYNVNEFEKFAEEVSSPGFRVQKWTHYLAHLLFQIEGGRAIERFLSGEGEWDGEESLPLFCNKPRAAAFRAAQDSIVPERADYLRVEKITREEYDNTEEHDSRIGDRPYVDYSYTEKCGGYIADHRCTDGAPRIKVVIGW